MARTLNASIDTTAALMVVLYAGVSTAIRLHAVELPAGWAPCKTILVLPDGGVASLTVPMVREQFTFKCYGATPAEGRTVDQSLFDALHRENPVTATVSSKTVTFGPAIRTMGPRFMREPVTEWAYWVSAYTLEISEFGVSP
jgi:hypothetical protein